MDVKTVFDYRNTVMGNFPIGRRDLARLRLERFLEVAPLEGKILEIGCGAGRFISAIRACKSAYYLCGCDLSLRAIREANIVYGRRIHFQVADAEHLPYKDNSFNVVLCFDVLEHIYNVNMTLQEIRRVLTPKGILHLFVPCEANYLTLDWLLWKVRIGHELKRKWAGHINRWTTKELLQIIKKNHFNVVKIRYALHPVGQISNYLFVYLSREMLSWFKKKEHRERLRKDNIGVMTKSKYASYLHTFSPFRELWNIAVRAFQLLAYYESRILVNSKWAIGVQLTCFKEQNQKE